MAVVATHSLLWSAFVTYALSFANGDARVEMSVGIAVAGFATGGAVVLAVYPPIAWIHLLAQCGPMLVWSLLERGRIGLQVFTLVVAFVLFVGALIVANHQHLLEMFRTVETAENGRIALERHHASP